MHVDTLKGNFRAFLIYLWRHLGLPDPTAVQMDIAYYLQHGPRRKGIKAFRGVGKSWITSAYVVWRLWKDINLKVLVVSASKERSDAFSIFTKRIIAEVPFLSHMTPDRRLGDRDSNVSFDIRGCTAAHAPSVKSVGITGQMTGSRADLIVADDVEVVNNSETAAQREKLRLLVAEMGGAILTPGGELAFLGTPQVEDSLYGHLEDAGYDFCTWPAEIPETADVYTGQLGPCIIAAMEAGATPGDPTDPGRFDRAELAERRLEYGKQGFALQFQLDTSLSDADRHPLKLADFIVAQTDVDIAPEKLVWASGPAQEMPHIPLLGLPGDRFFRPMKVSEKWSPYEGKIMYVDPSGRGRDTTGYAVVGSLHGYLVTRKWGKLEGGYDEATLAKIVTIARDEKVQVIVVESNFGDGMYAELLKPVLARIYPTCGLEDDHVTGQKEQRIIDNVEPALAGHRIVLDESCLRELVADRSTSTDPDAVLKTPLYQLTRVAREKGCLKYDDALDAFAGAIRWWTDAVGRDADVEVKEREQERIDQTLADFAEGLSVWKKPDPTKIPTKTWGNPLES